MQRFGVVWSDLDRIMATNRWGTPSRTVDSTTPLTRCVTTWAHISSFPGRPSAQDLPEREIHLAWNPFMRDAAPHRPPTPRSSFIRKIRRYIQGFILLQGRAHGDEFQKNRGPRVGRPRGFTFIATSAFWFTEIGLRLGARQLGRERNIIVWRASVGHFERCQCGVASGRGKNPLPDRRP